MFGYMKKRHALSLYCNLTICKYLKVKIESFFSNSLIEGSKFSHIFTVSVPITTKCLGLSKNKNEMHQPLVVIYSPLKLQMFSLKYFTSYCTIHISARKDEPTNGRT